MATFNRVTNETLKTFKFIAKCHIPKGKTLVLCREFTTPIKALEGWSFERDTTTVKYIDRDPKRGVITLSDEFNAYSLREFSEEFISELSMYIAIYNNSCYLKDY